MISSYEKNNYDDVIYSIVTAFQPDVCVELGVLHGYSTRAICAGIAKNKKGKLHAYDLFEDYPYNHGNQADVQATLDVLGYCFSTLTKKDAFTVHTNYRDGEVHFLHVDLSNTGETVRKIMELWDPKMCRGGVILFEGGSEERDNIEWMKKYKATPIKPEIDNNPIIKEKYIYGTYLRFPSLTMLLKKRD